MTVKNLPVRYPELGRIRLGEKGKKGEPVKLETFRFTSPDDYTVKAVAAVLGGDVEPWVDEKAGIDDQWQVVTDAKSIEVLIPPDPLDIAYERWGSGGRQRRCDGETCIVALRSEAEDGAHFEEKPCFCLARGLVPGDAEDVKKGGCDLVVRLKVVIPSLPGLGVWLLTSGSIYAAMELPGQLALLARLREQGALVPADLCIDQRTEKKQWERYTREYPVPVLRVRRSMRQLQELAAGGGDNAGALGMGAPALETGEHRESSRRSTIADLPPMTQNVIYACSKVGLTDEQAHATALAISKGRTSSRKDLNTTECSQFLAALADGSWEQLAVAGEQPGTVFEAPAAPTAEPAPPRGDPAGLKPGVRDALNTLVSLPDDLKAEAQQLCADRGLPDKVEDLTDEQAAVLIEIADSFRMELDGRNSTGAPAGASWSADEWKDAAKRAGLTPAALLKHARTVAAELGITQPGDLDTLTKADTTLTARVKGWLDEQSAA